ncbi:MAG: endonuclease III [Candidatus Dojkabacteria bacterium]|nr:MAG: endonuclease III [Candidatus Dojkabacteria bacterium]
MTKKERANIILQEIEELFPGAKSELSNWDTPFQFLICIILSAQTTDAQVNRVTSGLFAKYPDPPALKKARLATVQKLIHGANYKNNKAKHIIETARMIDEDFCGEVPDKVEELVKLPGVGNKTANVFLNDLYESNQGIGADTHIMRVSQRLGLTNKKKPGDIAYDLQRLYDRADWHRVNTLFVLYGRYYCKARVKPEVSKCIFKERGWCSWCAGK